MERITNRKATTAASADASAASNNGGGVMASAISSVVTAPSSAMLSTSNGEKKNNNSKTASVGENNRRNDDDSNLKNDMNTRSRPFTRSNSSVTTSSASSYYFGFGGVGFGGWKTALLSSQRFQWLCSMRFLVLLILCLQNSLFTVLRRFSQGVLHEDYSKYEALLLAEIIKIIVSARMIQGELRTAAASNSRNRNILISNNNSLNSSTHSQSARGGEQEEQESAALLSHSLSSSSESAMSSKINNHASSNSSSSSFGGRLRYLIGSSRKMVVLASIYGTMNILSFYSLLNIGAGMFTIFAQCKILTTAICSTLMLNRQYSWTKWRALTSLMLGVVLFSEPIWGNSGDSEAIAEASVGDITNRLRRLIVQNNDNPRARPLLGMCTQAIEVTLSGFASIYFEKVIKVDPLHHTIWERNFQLALASIPVHVVFILYNGGGTAGFGGGWSWTAVCVSLLGAAGGLLVALSIKYGDAILKTLATTGSILISSVLDHFLLGGPLSPFMAIAAGQVIISICNYTFDTEDIAESAVHDKTQQQQLQQVKKQEPSTATIASTTLSLKHIGNKEQEEEMLSLLQDESESAKSVGPPSVNVV
jgi:solute carrier family 35 (UDP-sugar transporter), member A1/2/3